MLIGPEEIERLLEPYRAAAMELHNVCAPVQSGRTATAVEQYRLLDPAPDWSTTYEKLSLYLELILKWNARTNLTAIREPQEIVQRHFGESLFLGSLPALGLASGFTMLDFGSGGGFPGVPIQILRPDLRVTLAESQGKKAAFLREVLRTLGLASEVWAARVETMAKDRRFDVVAMRAVDRMPLAIRAGADRASQRIAVIATSASLVGRGWPPVGFRIAATVSIPRSTTRSVPRSTPLSTPGSILLSTLGSSPQPTDGVVAIAGRGDQQLFHVEPVREHSAPVRSVEL